MSRRINGARFAVLLLTLTPTLALPAAGEDLAGWLDDEVNAALAGTELRPPSAQMRRADLCAAIAAGDTASAVDCEVNEALSAQLSTLAPSGATTISVLRQ